MTREEFLRQWTYKDDGLDLGRRVFYTLTHDDPRKTESIPAENFPGKLTAAKNAKLLAILINKLHELDVISDTDVDDFLMELI